jgi:hypothetical protein
MIDDNDELRWLKAQQPPVEPPDAETTMWARAAVLAHAEKARQLPHLVARTPAGPAPRTHHSMSRFLKRHRALAAAAAVAAMAVAGVTAMVGIPHTGDKGLVNGVPTAQAKTLLALSSRVLAASPPPGDATLVQHSNKLIDGTFTGADLYLDNGHYYYAPTVAGLHNVANGGPSEVGYDLQPAIEAAAGVAKADPQTARAAFLQAISSSLYPKIGLPPATLVKQDNYIWITAMDALGAAYGRPEVLAGMLNVLATIDGLTVAHDTYQGQPVLELTLTTHVVPSSPEALRADAARATDAGMREKLEAAAKQRASHPAAPYTDVETLTLNDQTGALLVYQDKPDKPGAEEGEGVTVAYHVSRVEAADYGLR